MSNNLILVSDCCAASVKEAKDKNSINYYDCEKCNRNTTVSKVEKPGCPCHEEKK